MKSNASNDFVTVSLFDQYSNPHWNTIQSSSARTDEESGHDGNVEMHLSSHITDTESQHGASNLLSSPSMSRQRGQGWFTELTRKIVLFTLKNPTIATILVICLIVISFVLFIVVLVLAARPPTMTTTQTAVFVDEDAVWSTFQASSSSGVVATDHPLCSSIGADILRIGGNAVDASIAAKLCLGVVSPASSGIGGGAHILIHDQQTGKNIFIDAREVAPQAATPDMFESNPLAAQNGGLAIAVPGEIIGLYTAKEKYGSSAVSWYELVLPAAALAKSWVISDEMAAYIQGSATYITSNEYPELSRLFLNPHTNRLKGSGETVNQPTLAQFLMKLAVNGPNAFYNDVAKTVAEEIQAAGGIITEEDIRSYEPLIYEDNELVRSSFMGYEYVGVGGSSSGGAAVAGLMNFLQGYPEAMASLGDVYYHRLAEAMKHVFAIRMSLGDPYYVNTTSATEALIDPTYMTHLREITSDDTVLPLEEYGGQYNLTTTLAEDHGTTHLSVMDQWGNAVAMTSTVNTYFGSKVISPSTGILFNNEMDDFSVPGASNFFGLAPSPFNYPEPKKRPLSSMSPSFLFDSTGKLRLIGGASGGPHIITATAQVIFNYIGRGLSLLDAVRGPRIHSQLLPDTVYVENNTALYYPTIEGRRIVVDDVLVKALKIRRHKINGTDTVGICQFIAIDPDTGIRIGVSDPRKGGVPAHQ